MINHEIELQGQQHLEQFISICHNAPLATEQRGDKTVFICSGCRDEVTHAVQVSEDK